MPLIAAEEATFWGTLASQVVVAVVVYCVIEWIKRLHFAPNLLVQFRGDKFGRVETYSGRWMKPDASAQAVTSRQYVRVSVTNCGRDTARRCRGFIVGIERITGRDSFEPLLFDHIPLSWSYLENEPSQVIDIPADGTTIVNLDVFSTKAGDCKFSPSFVTFPNCYKGLFGEQAAYRLTVRVTADNATSKTTQLVLDWRGDWKDFDIVEYRG